MTSNRYDSGTASVPFLGNVSQEGLVRYFGGVLPVFGAMLLLTAAITGWMVVSDAWELVYGFGLAGLFGLLVVQILLIVAARAFREAFPLNAVFGFLFAAFEGVFISPIIAGYVDAGLAGLVGQALGVTAVVFVAMSAIPLVTGMDFRFLGGFLLAALVGLIGAVLLNVFLFQSGTLGIVLSAGSVVLFSAFILYDMSKILENDMGPVTGAIALYLDFVLIFLNVLELLAEAE